MHCHRRRGCASRVGVLGRGEGLYVAPLPPLQQCSWHDKSSGSGAESGVVPLASRTKKGMSKLVDKLNELHNGPASMIGPLSRLSKTLLGNIASHPWRGVILPSGEVSWKQVSRASSPPVWFAFSGMYTLPSEHGFLHWNNCELQSPRRTEKLSHTFANC